MPGRDLRAPVAALRAVARVAETPHQLDERVRDAPRRPNPDVRGGSENAVARQRRCDHVERVLGVTAVQFRIRQSRDDVEELHDRAGPAVHDQQRERVGVRGSRVDEVDRLAVDAGAEVVELVEPRLLGAPVVLVAPVRHELAHVGDGSAVLPARAVDLLREAGHRQPEPEVFQRRVVHPDVEPLDVLRHAVRLRDEAEPCPEGGTAERNRPVTRPSKQRRSDE